MTTIEQIKELEIEVCLALKLNRNDSVEWNWQKMIAHAQISKEDAAKGVEPVIIGCLKNVLILAARSHKEYFFEKWLPETWDVLRRLSHSEGLADFVNAVLFAAADRKLVSVLPQLDVITKQFLRLAISRQWPLDAYASEWLSTAAEISNRGLSEYSIFLVKGYLRILYFMTDWQVIQRQLRSYYFCFQVACQRSGYEKACQIFGLVHYFEIICFERINSMPEGIEQQQWGRRFCRGICDLLCNVARVTGRSEKDILLAWHHFVTVNESDKLQQRFQRLYMAELLFWKVTKPVSFQALGFEE